MNNRTVVLQDTFYIMEKLAAICATPGINTDTQEVANKHIQELLNGPIKTSVTELKSASAGIVTLT
jgi:hypothetical protein